MAQALMVWSDDYLLGHASMDATHRDFVDGVRELQLADDDRLLELLLAFETHALAHFGDEQRWMDETAFPAAACHAEEHARVLASLREVAVLLADGVDVRVARDLTAALVNWFPGHADHMDSALSHWIGQRVHGGAPVVIRRRPV